ncbi:MAG: STAS domain-containing protein [Nitrospinae bacterium]|nr:STAS domain-containing protein [Nitrospinota bacterium]
MKIKVSVEGGVSVFSVDGKLNFESQRILHKEFKKNATSHGSKYIFDLSGVTVIDSIGLALLVAMNRTVVAMDGKFCVVLKEGAAREPVLITSLNALFPVFDDIQSAHKYM